jgi:DNA-binding response OmpR family regulator
VGQRGGRVAEVVEGVQQADQVEAVGRVAGRVERLTKLEFDVLQYLHEREGRVVSRAALLRDVWGYDWSGGSNVVEVVISALRRKLGDSAGSLQTVRGAGYRFTAPP